MELRAAGGLGGGALEAPLENSYPGKPDITQSLQVDKGLFKQNNKGPVSIFGI